MKKSASYDAASVNVRPGASCPPAPRAKVGGAAKGAGAAGAGREASRVGADSDAPRPETVYVFTEPKEELKMSEHFSSLLLMSGEGLNTAVELGLLAVLVAAVMLLPPEVVNVPGSMPLAGVAALLCSSTMVVRLYTCYLEAVYFMFPQHRTQPSHEHALRKSKKDLCGRELRQLELLNWHDRATLCSQFALNVGLYYALPGYYPSADAEVKSLPERAFRLLLHHYILSFGMYWMHRAYHVVPWLWKNIHGIHHWARHPLSRNTYQDHWLDNFGGAITGHFAAQVLVPLDYHFFWFSHIFRIFESLEKHSGVSCGWNLVHTAQSWLPYVQMPHHHDWHHEGHKGCNYTFTAIGGLWDCVFSTRRAGRALTREPVKAVATAHDVNSPKLNRGDGFFDTFVGVLTPLALLGAVVTHKIAGSGFDLGEELVAACAQFSS